MIVVTRIVAKLTTKQRFYNIQTKLKAIAKTTDSKYIKKSKIIAAKIIMKLTIKQIFYNIQTKN